MILDREKFTKKMEECLHTNITLAQATKMSTSTISKARTGGEVRPTTVKKLCAALNCEAKDILAE